MSRRRTSRLLSWVLAQAPFSRQQWVTVSISFLLAVTLWFLVTINTKTYSTKFTIPVRLVNFPGEYQLVKDFPTELEVEATGQGNKLLVELYDAPDTLNIDFQTLSGRTYFIGHENLDLIGSALEDGIKVNAVRPDSIFLLKLRKASKKVPVRLASNWDLPTSYRLSGPKIPSPDSVLVTGPIDSLANIHFWKTQPYTITLSDEPTMLTLALDTHAFFEVVPKEVRLTVHPEPYTELKFQIPIECSGMPPRTAVHFQPDSVWVHFLAPFRLADSITVDQFQAWIGYEEIDGRSPYVIPRITHFPTSVELIGPKPNLVEYTVISYK